MTAPAPRPKQITAGTPPFWSWTEIERGVARDWWCRDCLRAGGIDDLLAGEPRQHVTETGHTVQLGERHWRVIGPGTQGPIYPLPAGDAP